MINELDYYTQRVLDTADICEVKINEEKAKQIVWRKIKWER